MKARSTTAVFLGPSLDSKEAATYLEADYLPPIRRGDLPSAIAGGAQAIGIIDGEFGQSLAVSVMEVRAALEQDVRIWGAASMGALRAAECESLGMRGVGWIFQRYVDGSLQSDDEVALLFDPWSKRSTTIPLVNVRWAVLLALQEGIVDASTEPALIEVARKVQFAVRTYEGLVEAASGSPVNAEMHALVEFMKKEPLRTDRKRLDAIMLLDEMRQSVPGPRTEPHINE